MAQERNKWRVLVNMAMKNLLAEVPLASRVRLRSTGFIRFSPKAQKLIVNETKYVFFSVTLPRPQSYKIINFRFKFKIMFIWYVTTCRLLH